MLKLFIGAGLMSLYFTTCAAIQSHNPRLLEEYSDAIFRSLLSCSVSQKEISENLEFVHDESLLQKKLNDFTVLYNSKIAEIKNPSFLEFASCCKKIYDTETNKKKIAIGMLFESTTDKFIKYLRKLEKLEKIKSKEEEEKIIDQEFKSYLEKYKNIF